MLFTNKTDISLSLAVWLAHDEYDYINEPNYISATSLMKPLRQIILPCRIPAAERVLPDTSEHIAAALGHSLHDSIEKAWVKGHRKNLAKLGIPENVINRVLINPTDEELAAVKDPIPVYLEQRAVRSFGGFSIGGKFDLVADGIVHDNKSTSAFVWAGGTRDDEHALQGSLYRWLNPTKITEDFIRINYIFTDWQRALVKSNPKYPDSRLKTKDIPLLSIAATENWIRNKLNQLDKYMSAPEKEIPRCTDEELWRSDPQYKYYADPTKMAGRSTKNFDSMAEAKAHLSEKGHKGVIKIIPGEVKRCGYCAAYDICTQKDEYFHD